MPSSAVNVPTHTTMHIMRQIIPHVVTRMFLTQSRFSNRMYSHRESPATSSGFACTTQHGGPRVSSQKSGAHGHFKHTHIHFRDEEFQRFLMPHPPTIAIPMPKFESFVKLFAQRVPDDQSFVMSTPAPPFEYSSEMAWEAFAKPARRCFFQISTSA